MPMDSFTHFYWGSIAGKPAICMGIRVKDLLIIGAGGLGRETAWLVERINRINPTWNLLGFIDDNDRIWNREMNGYRVIGDYKKIMDYPEAYVVCAVAASRTRESIIKKVTKLLPEVKFATLIDPTVEMSDFVLIGEGSIICAHTIISVDVTIGNHVIIDWNSTVGHDAVIEDYVMLYPSVNVSGATRIETGVELGTGMQIIQGKKIGRYTVVGAGAVVVKDLPQKCTAVGNPARPIKFHE